ncbi:MAG TPA: ATP-binding protein [Candidatus Avimonoglobus intestinipullorum]|uniref:ATP-binding protein n=1 Tax=Candidatus Avimonoglobus intestinipullorum TaxID=2840699 RepID=A0A9D1LUD5_9FIRM|nr:ATP-binding protein [Candidatus Avimonoglobus intestinipullorum]
MDNTLDLHFTVDGSDFTLAGETSSKVKKTLNQLGFNPAVVRRVAIAMYEGEINMVIHANGGTIDVQISPERIVAYLRDTGPGIPDVEKAMQEGYSTATNKVRELGFGAGMGLPNMKKYTDEMEIETTVGEGTTVKLVINVQQA